MSNPGPASTQTQESFATMTNVVKGGVFPLSVGAQTVTANGVTAVTLSSTGIGLLVGDFVSVSQQSGGTTNLTINGSAYVSGADALTINIINPTAGTTFAASTILVSVQRPSTSTGTNQTTPLLSW